MDKVVTIEGAAAPLLIPNVDTDKIIRIERLMQNTRQALGQYALEVLRYDTDGRENPEFVLNREPYRGAPILLSGSNFGCGSSREGAVWALLGAGIRCVIAESFGEIFYNNCFQNGMLPIRLEAAQIASLSQASIPMKVDLTNQTITAGALKYGFEIESIRRDALMEGVDEITRTLRYRERIADWQNDDRLQRPWLWEPVALRRT